MKLFGLVKGVLKIPFLYEMFMVLDAISDVYRDVKEDREPTQLELGTISSSIHGKLSGSWKDRASLTELNGFLYYGIKFFQSGKAMFRKNK